MAVITTGAHPKALWPGVYAWFGAKYDEHPTEYTELFDTKTSAKNYEELAQHTGFGLVPVKPESSSTVYEGHSQGYIARAIHVAYSMGFIVTHEELEDNLYREVSLRRSGSLAFSANQTRENVGANVYNRAFNSAYLGGDAKELCATDHPSLAGDQSNELAVGAAFSEASLEDLTIQIMQAVDTKGLKISLRPISLLGPVGLVYEFERVLKSSLQNDTANNAINALRSSGAIPKASVNHYFSDANNWFIRTNAPEGLCWFDREATSFKKDEDFDTDNAKAKCYMRFSTLWGDWRTLYGSAPA